MGTTLADFTSETRMLSRYYEEAHWLAAMYEFPVTPKLTTRLSVEYDLVEAELVGSMIELVRDLHCWKGSLGVGRDNGDFRLMFLLQLKAFPGVKVGAGG